MRKKEAPKEGRGKILQGRSQKGEEKVAGKLITQFYKLITALEVKERKIER